MGEHRRVTRLLERARGENGAQVRVKNGRLIISGSGSGFSLRRFAFGWMGYSGQQVTIAAGYMEGRYGYHAIAGATVNVGGNATAKHLIIVTGNEAGGQIEVNSVLESAFSGDASNQWRRILYRVYLNKGRPVLDMVGAGIGGIVL